MGLITFALILCSGTEAFEVLAGKWTRIPRCQANCDKSS